MIIGPNPGTHASKMMVILLHGYGSCGENMTHLAYGLDIPGVTFWCPDGPQVCEAYPGGRQWFSLKDMDWQMDKLYESWNSIAAVLGQAAKNLYTEIQEKWGNYSGPVVVGGFSQGAMMAYELGLFHPHFQGILGFSGAYCLTTEPKYQPPVFWTHARDDQVVPCHWMMQSNELFVQNGLAPTHCITPYGGHSIPETALVASRTFLQQLLAHRESKHPRARGA
jgi:phospholipase/carboxylesterase